MDENQDDSEASASTEISVSPLDPQRSSQSQFGGAWRWLRSRPGRLVVTALSSLLVIGALAALLAGETSVSMTTFYDDFTGIVPTPTEPILPGQDTFILFNDAPWGKLTVDGRSVPFNAPEVANIAPGFVLPRGVHHLVYQASHFPTLRCVISVPMGIHDTCPLVNHQGDGAGGVIDQERYLDLEATPERLSQADYQALLATVKTALQADRSDAIIEPGERYVNTQGQTLIATAPLTYTLGLTLGSTPLSSGYVSDCCDSQGQPGVTSHIIALPIRADITLGSATSTGATAGALAPLSINSASITNQLDLAVNEDEQGGWVVSDPGSAGELSALTNELMLQASNNFSGYSSSQIAWLGASAASPAEGAAAAELQNGVATSTIILWRFGVIYAVNDATAKQFPQLPRANSAEQALAMYILNNEESAAKTSIQAGKATLGA